MGVRDDLPAVSRSRNRRSAPNDGDATIRVGEGASRAAPRDPAESTPRVFQPCGRECHHPNGVTADEARALLDRMARRHTAADPCRWPRRRTRFHRAGRACRPGSGRTRDRRTRDLERSAPRERHAHPASRHRIGAPDRGVVRVAQTCCGRRAGSRPPDVVQSGRGGDGRQRERARVRGGAARARGSCSVGRAGAPTRLGGEHA